jgi:hypothetical protein
MIDDGFDNVERFFAEPEKKEAAKKPEKRNRLKNQKKKNRLNPSNRLGSVSHQNDSMAKAEPFDPVFAIPFCCSGLSLDKGRAWLST